MIYSILTRRFWIIKNRLLSTFGLLFLLPVFLHVVINLPFKRLVVNQLWNIPHEQWILPGLVIIVAFVMMIPAIFRDLFELRIHKKLLPSVALTPISKHNFLYAFLIAVIIESALYSTIVMWIFSIIMIPGLGIVKYLIMFPFIVLFIGIGANLLITLSLLVDKTTLYNILMLTFFIFIIFGSGLIIEFEFFPLIIGNILKFLPTGQIMHTMRMAMFSGIVNWLIIIITFLTILIWGYINSIIFTKRLYR